MTAPVLLSHVDPEFSGRARKEKISGICTVSVLIDTEGIPQNLTISKSIADSVSHKHQAAARSLDEKALEAVRQFRFKPATFAGKPVPVTIEVGVSFQVY